jgi:hypothetical protein
MVGRDIFCHDAPGSHNDSFADSHSRKDNAIASKPAVLTNGDWLTGLGAFGSIANGGIYRMRTRVEGTIWTDQSASPNGYQARIDPSTAAIDIDIVTESGESAIFCSTWSQE